MYKIQDMGCKTKTVYYNFIKIRFLEFKTPLNLLKLRKFEIFKFLYF